MAAISAAEAGIIPYLANTRSIDTAGLNDNVVTRGTEEEKRRYLEENPLDVDYDLSTTGALDDFAFLIPKRSDHLDAVREAARRRFAVRARDYYYAGNFVWGVDVRRREFVLWVRKEHPRAAEIVRSLASAADRWDVGRLRWGPYPEELLEDLVPGRR